MTVSCACLQRGVQWVGTKARAMIRLSSVPGPVYFGCGPSAAGIHELLQVTWLPWKGPPSSRSENRSRDLVRGFVTFSSSDGRASYNRMQHLLSCLFFKWKALRKPRYHKHFSVSVCVHAWVPVHESMYTCTHASVTLRGVLVFASLCLGMCACLQETSAMNAAFGNECCRSVFLRRSKITCWRIIVIF